MGKIYKNPLKHRLSRDFFTRIPKSPGVYFMRCAKGEVIYIGKATCLRSRIRSYQSAKPKKVGKNIIKLLENVVRIEWEVHESEVEAFARELELIRAFVPRYNIADAWQERYLFIGLRRQRENFIEFRLTYKEEDTKDFTLHGCYPRRTRVKEGYSALLRILYACFHEGSHFHFPSKITRPSPCYDFKMKIPEAKKWQKLISEFLHGQKSTFLRLLVDRLLSNETIPEYVRPGIQRDILALKKFEDLCLRLGKVRNREERRTISHDELRIEIQRSISVESVT